MFSPLTKTNCLLRPDLYSVNIGKKKQKKNKLAAWSVITAAPTNELTFKSADSMQKNSIRHILY